MADKVLRFPTLIPTSTYPADAPVAAEPLWREVVGEQLRAERVDRRLRIVDVAQRAGVAPQYLSELERGRKDPSSEVLSALPGALGLTVHQLTRRAGVRLLGSVSRIAGQSLPSGPICLAA